MKMVQKLCLETVPHPNPYQVCGLCKGVEIEVNKQCLVSFSISKTYKDEVWCNVFPMKKYHLLLGDHGFMIDGLLMMVSSILILLR